jgi:4-hydroxybenzoate polyprenyltransferase
LEDSVLLNILKTMRPRQWTKNLLVYIPFVFTLKQYWQPFTPKMWEFLAIATGAFFLFCVFSGVVYLLNDITDIEKDRQHPRKKFRPLASGALKRGQAIGAIIILLAVAIPLAFLLNPMFGVVALIYLTNNLLYSYWLKNIVIVDVLSVSGGFLLRALGGAAAIQVPASHWLFVCTGLLTLFISFSKRRHELVLLEGEATSHRVVLKEYTPELLDEMIAVTTASFVMAYSLYTFSAENLPPNRAMMLTIPFALYIVFRLLYLVHVKNEGGSPEEMLARDRPLAIAIILWGAVSAAILFWFGRV